MMQLENFANNSDLPAKLANLEDQVIKLTSELAIDKDTIDKLKQLVSEKQSEIAELEAALIAAQRTLSDKVLSQIRDYQHRISAQAVTPALQKIQQQIDQIQQYITEIKQFIDSQIIVINNTIRKTSTIVSELPTHARAFFAQAYAEIVKSKINQLIALMNQHIEKIKQLIEQKVIDPVQTTLTKIVSASKQKTTQLQMNVEQKLIKVTSESVSEFFDDLVFSGKELLKESIAYVRNTISNLLANLKRTIQNSGLYKSFGESIKSIRHPTTTAFA